MSGSRRVPEHSISVPRCLTVEAPTVDHARVSQCQVADRPNYMLKEMLVIGVGSIRQSPGNRSGKGRQLPTILVTSRF